MTLIRSLRYQWGLFDSPDDFDLLKAKTTVSLSEPSIPKEISRSFDEERIAELSGEYGDAAVGDPVEIGFFHAQTCRGEIKTHVFIRAIFMFHESDARLTRLHRFFCVLKGFSKDKVMIVQDKNLPEPRRLKKYGTKGFFLCHCI